MVYKKYIHYYYIINDTETIYTQKAVNKYIKTLPKRPSVIKIELYWHNNECKKYIRKILVKGLKPCHYTIS